MQIYLKNYGCSANQADTQLAPQGKKLIVAGCLPLINFERLNREVRFDGAVGPAAGDAIVDVVRRVLEGEKVVSLEGALTAKPSLSLRALLISSSRMMS